MDEKFRGAFGVLEVYSELYCNVNLLYGLSYLLLSQLPSSTEFIRRSLDYFNDLAGSDIVQLP